jgi:hypothetical protein
MVKQPMDIQVSFMSYSGDIRSQGIRDYCLQKQASHTAGFHRSQLGRPSAANQREGFTQSSPQRET